LNILQSYILFISEVLFIKAMKIWLLYLLVLHLFNFLGSSSASSVDASSFRCVVILSLYLTLNFVISFLIIGIFRSVCKILLGVYHGAFSVVRRT
jgi:hypothetical protein